VICSPAPAKPTLWTGSFLAVTDRTSLSRQGILPYHHACRATLPRQTDQRLPVRRWSVAVAGEPRREGPAHYPSVFVAQLLLVCGRWSPSDPCDGGG
jgi:hypothetical protein